MTPGTVVVYRRRNRIGLKRRLWDWKLVAANGNILCGSDQGYVNKQDALDMGNRIVILGHYAGAGIRIEETP